MARMLKDPKEIFPEVTDDFKAIFGDGLIAIIAYGSAVSGDYIAGQSDINFIVVVSEDRMKNLDRTFSVVSRWKKHRVATPLFLTEEYVRTSLDVFPIEYMNFRNNHEVVYGKDILRDLVFAPRFVRLQCEREIKGKLLLLREAFLESEGKGRPLLGVIAESLRAFVAVFGALLFLKGKEIPHRKREVVEQACEAFGLDGALFDRLFGLREEGIRLSESEMQTIFKAYLNEVRKLWKLVDSFEKEMV